MSEYHFIQVQHSDGSDNYSYVAFSYKFYFTSHKGTEAVKFAKGLDAYEEMKLISRKFPDRIFRVTGLEPDVNFQVAQETKSN
jgi:hypothetical protein